MYKPVTSFSLASALGLSIRFLFTVDDEIGARSNVLVKGQSISRTCCKVGKFPTAIIQLAGRFFTAPTVR